MLLISHVTLDNDVMIMIMIKVHMTDYLLCQVSC